MKVSLLVVGRARGPLAPAIAEFEERVRRYFGFEVVEVKETSARGGRSAAEVMEAEAERLLAKVPPGFELMALDRKGASWSSEKLAQHLERMAVTARPGVALVIGGAFGIAPSLLERADRTLSLSALTLPHDLARLLLTEQLYRAGTIMRGEPYHKGEVG